MTLEQKLERHIQYWKSRIKPSFWPEYVYHFTDIHNAASILRLGKIFSREECIEKDLMKNDNACGGVIDRTSDDYKHYVRFYHAPLTPTQYINEGIKPYGYQGEAHCPIPVFFLINKEILLRDINSIVLTNGGVYSSDKKYFNSGMLSEMIDKIPFEYVFHRGMMGEEEKEKIKFHRHAEILFQSAVSLQDVAYVICRSRAEKKYLTSLIDSDNEFKRKIKRAKKSENLFYREGVYIDDIFISKKIIVIEFNKWTLYRENCNVSINNGIEIFRFYCCCNGSCQFNCPDGFFPGTYIVEVDGCVAFQGNL